MIFALDDTSVASGVRERETRRETLLKERLTDENITFTEESLFSDYGAYGVSIYVDVQSTSEGGGAQGGGGEKNFILAIPISSLDDTDEDFHFGLKFALDFIKNILQEGAPVPLRVAFLADDWGAVAGADGCAGLQALLDSIHDENTVVLYARLFFGGGTALQIVQASTNYTTPLSLLEPFIALCNAHDFLLNFPSNYNFLYRNGIAPNTPQIDMASKNGVNILFVKSGEGGTNSSGEQAEKLSMIVSRWIAAEKNFSQNIITNNSKNYMLLYLKSSFMILSEQKIILCTYIAELVLLFSVVLLYKYNKKRGDFLYLFLLLFFTLSIVIILFIDMVLLMLATLSLLFFTLLYHTRGAFCPRAVPEAVPDAHLCLASTLRRAFYTVAVTKMATARACPRSCVDRESRPPVRNIIVLCLGILFVCIPYIDIVVNLFSIFNLRNEQNQSMRETPQEYSVLNTVEPSFTVHTRDTLLLTRRLVHLEIFSSIETEPEPERFRLFFVSAKDSFLQQRADDDMLPPFVYLSPVPYLISEKGIEFILGSFPPKNISLDIALPLELEGSFYAEAYYPSGRVEKCQLEL
ncbi:MAG: hypothetical protein LBT01_03335 [Spirochaetaceae bacterium]|nr:hypothetical protein [Spirochaetaceae bacterium]